MLNREYGNTIYRFLALFLILALVLSGCGSGETTASESADLTSETGTSDSEASSDPSEKTEKSTKTTEKSTKDTDGTGESHTDPGDATDDSGYPVAESLTEDPNITEGLSKFFRRKLTVDPEKTKSYLNVRRYPDGDSEILAILFPNEVAAYLSKRGGWYEVQCDGFTGYVSADYVLTDSKAYEASRHNIGYAAMIREFDTVLYELPDETSQGIRLADKADVYPVSGVIGEFYRLDVVSDYVDYLYVKKDMVQLFYQFLGPNVTNGFDEGIEEYLGYQDLGDYQAICEELTAQAVKEKEEREAARIAYEEAIQASIQASIEESISAEAAARAAQEEAERAYRQSVEASLAADAAARAAQEEAARQSREAAAATLKQKAMNAESARRNFVASHGVMTAANVTRSGSYAVTLDDGVINHTISLCNQYGLDAAVVFSVMYHESRFHSTSVNSGTASAASYGAAGYSYGLMQIIPYWNRARMAACNVAYPDGLYDPYNNITVGVMILAEYGAQSDWVSALSRFRSGGLNDTGYNYALSVLNLSSNFDAR